MPNCICGCPSFQALSSSCVAILQEAVQVKEGGGQDWRQKLKGMEFAAFRGTSVTKQTLPYFHCDAKHLHVLVINNFCLEKILESC